jgi:hypothetical protein
VFFDDGSIIEFTMTDIRPQTTPVDFHETKSKGESFYSTLSEVWCPYLQVMVMFNAKGKEHLNFKGKYHARPRADQYMRWRLIKLAPKTIEASRTVQGFSERKVFELNRSNQRNERTMVEATYYEFVMVHEERIRVRVVVKKVGTAPPYFWSIIPFWKQHPATGKRQMAYGNPEED